MVNERDFYRCEKCGNMAVFIEHSGVKPVCCGQTMTKLIPNITDASQEKHVPAASLMGNELTVSIGSVLHPMTEEHHICWVAIANGNNTTFVTLEKTGSPVAKFCVSKGNCTIYEYCNLHGLWATEFN